MSDPSRQRWPAFERALARVDDYRKPGGYRFRRYPFGEEGGFVEAAMFEEFQSWFKGLALLGEPDIVAAPEPGGIQWGAVAAMASGRGLLPIRLARDEALNPIVNHYSTKRLVCAPGNGQSTVLVDDVLSSGETLSACVELLRAANYIVRGVAVICERNIGIAQRIALHKACPVYVMISDERPSI